MQARGSFHVYWDKEQEIDWESAKTLWRIHKYKQQYGENEPYKDDKADEIIAQMPQETAVGQHLFDPDVVIHGYTSDESTHTDISEIEMDKYDDISSTESDEDDFDTTEEDIPFE